MNAQWVAWVDEVTQGASMTKIADRIGVARSNVSHWMRDGIPAHAAVQIAVAYGADPIEGLIAAGWIRPDQVARLNLTDTLRRVPSVQLAAEIRRRTGAAQRHVS